MKITHFKKLIFASGLSLVLLITGCGSFGVTYDFSDVEKKYTSYNNTLGQSADSLQKDFNEAYDVDNKLGEIGVFGEGGVGFNNKISNKSEDEKKNIDNNNNTITKENFSNFFTMFDSKDSTESDRITTFKVLDVVNNNEVVFAYQTFQYDDPVKKTYPETPMMTAKIVRQKWQNDGSSSVDLIWEYTKPMTDTQLKKYKDNIEENGVYSTDQTVFFQELFCRDDMQPYVQAFAVLVLEGTNVRVDYIPRHSKQNKSDFLSVDITDAVKKSYEEANSGNKFNNYEITGFSICGSVPNNYEINLDMSMSSGSDKVNINEEPDDNEVENSSKNYLTRIDVGHGTYNCSAKNTNKSNQIDYIKDRKDSIVSGEITIDQAYSDAKSNYKDKFGNLEVEINDDDYILKYLKNKEYKEYEITKDQDKKSNIKFGDYIYSGDDTLYILDYDLQYTGQTTTKVTIEGEEDEDGHTPTYSVKVIDKRDYRIESTYMKVYTLTEDYPDTIPLYNKVCVDFLEDSVEIIDANMVEHDEILDFETDSTIIRIDTRVDASAEKFIIYVEDESNVYLYYFDPKKRSLEALFGEDGIPSSEFNLGKPTSEPEAMENDEAVYDVGGVQYSLEELQNKFKDEFSSQNSIFNLSDYTKGTIAGQTNIDSAANSKETSISDLTPKDINDVTKEMLGELGDSEKLNLNNIVTNAENSSANSKDIQEQLDAKKKEEQAKQKEKEEEILKQEGVILENTQTEQKPKKDDDVKLTDVKDPYDNKEMTEEIENENKNTSSISSAALGTSEGGAVEEYNTSHEVLSANSFYIENGNIYVFTLNSGIIKYNPKKKYINDKGKEKEKQGFDVVNAHSVFMYIGTGINNKNEVKGYYISYEDQDGSYTHNDIAEAQRIPNTEKEFDLSKILEVKTYNQ